eukprot:3527941-Rhodomonas_salina.1
MTRRRGPEEECGRVCEDDVKREMVIEEREEVGVVLEWVRNEAFLHWSEKGAGEGGRAASGQGGGEKAGGERGEGEGRSAEEGGGATEGCPGSTFCCMLSGLSGVTLDAIIVVDIAAAAASFAMLGSMLAQSWPSPQHKCVADQECASQTRAACSIAPTTHASEMRIQCLMAAE